MNQIFHLQAKVLESRPLGEAYHQIVLLAPKIAARAKPGQFLHCSPSRPEEPTALLRRPVSLSGVAASQAKGAIDSVEITFHLVGAGTRLLARRRPGQIIDTLGPLGNGFTLYPDKRALLIAGGAGIAPMRWLAQALVEAGGEVLLLAGARSQDDFPYTVERHEGRTVIPLFERLGAASEFVTDEQGELVTDLIRRRLPELRAGKGALQAYAVGPRPMLRALLEVLGEEVPCQVSLEERMACGIGACRGCVITMRGDAPGDFVYKRVCKDGPVFDLREVAWDQEKISV